MQPDDVILLILIAVCVPLPWVGWRLLRRNAYRRDRQRALVLAAARQEVSLSRKRQLMMHWNDLGGYEATKRKFRREVIRQLGQEARGKGTPISGNPYCNRLWGPGRQWKAGWKSVDQKIQWIENKRV